MEKMNKKHHFVQVHGGGWCWYKINTLLQTISHQVIALDLAASGTNLKKLNEVRTFLEYLEPLIQFMETIPSEERVVLVGHSLGGMNIAYAMERFPQKVFVGVPSCRAPQRLSYVIKKLFEFVPREAFLDTQFSPVEGTGNPKVTILFGAEFSSSMFYQLSPPEDYTLGVTLLRVGSLFLEDLSTSSKFSEERYGSVRLAYIVSLDDKVITKVYQQWMITSNPVKQEKPSKVLEYP